MKRLISILLAALLCIVLFAPAAGAAVNVERSSSENPVQEISRATIAGSLVGLLLGGAVVLARDGKDTGSTLRWSVAGGTFFGFAYGLYYVNSRPRAAALLQFQDGDLGLGLPLPSVEPGKEVRIAVVSARF